MGQAHTRIGHFSKFMEAKDRAVPDPVQRRLSMPLRGEYLIKFGGKMMNQLSVCGRMGRKNHPKKKSIMKNGQESEITMWMLRQL